MVVVVVDVAAILVFVDGLVGLVVIVNASHRKPIFKVWSKLSQ